MEIGHEERGHHETLRGHLSVGAGTRPERGIGHVTQDAAIAYLGQDMDLRISI